MTRIAVYRRHVDEPLPALPPVDPASAHVDPETFSPEMLAALLVEGDDELAAWALRESMSLAPRAAVFDELLAGAMDLVGRRWEAGQWTVAEEHRASLTVLRALERSRVGVNLARRGPGRSQTGSPTRAARPDPAAQRPQLTIRSGSTAMTTGSPWSAYRSAVSCGGRSG